MRIRWTPAAADDLQHIFDYLRESNPGLARSTIIDIRDGVRSLKNFPHQGRPGREPGTRNCFMAACPISLLIEFKTMRLKYCASGILPKTAGSGK